MDRRSFLKGGAALAASPALAAVAGLSPAWAAAQDPANIRNWHPDMRYRPHGLTGVGVSALGFGMLRLPMLRHAIDHGLNYVDTGYVYLGGQSEAVTGKALAEGWRDRVWLTSKSPWWIMERPRTSTGSSTSRAAA